MVTPPDRIPRSELIHCDPARWETRAPLMVAFEVTALVLAMVAVFAFVLWIARKARHRHPSSRND